MGATVLTVVQGEPPSQTAPNSFRDGAGTGIPILLFLALVLFLGLSVPAPLDHLLREAAAFLEVKR